MENSLARYDAARLSGLSGDRRQASLHVLRNLDECVGGLQAINRSAIEDFLTKRWAAGDAPGTLHKKRAIISAFSSWAYSEGLIDADRLIGVRAARAPVRALRQATPRPYRVAELSKLTALLDERWPRYSDSDEAERWLKRFRDGRSPYSRVRSHVTRCQLDAVIAQALHVGLRRREVFALDIATGHPDNDVLIVYRDSARTLEHARSVPNTSAARKAMAAWDRCRWALQPDCSALWLNTHARTTASVAMTRDTFDRLLRTCVGTGWTLKRLRDTCAVRWLDGGLAPEHLRQLLGLSRIEDVMPYFRLMRASLDDGLSAAEERSESTLTLG